MPEDLDLFFQDELMSVEVYFGGVHTRGVLDYGADTLGDGLMQSDQTTLLVKSRDFPVLPVAGDLISVEGADFEVNVPFQKVDDGRIGKIGLQRPL